MKYIRRNLVVIIIAAIILPCLLHIKLREWIFSDMEHALVFISVVFPIINLLATRNLKTIDLRHDYLKILHEKRVESYPKLHVLTDELGTLSRGELIRVAQLKDYLKKIAEWDACYAIFAGEKTTRDLFCVRRKLEELIKDGKNISDKEVCNDLFCLLAHLEYDMKIELKVLLESDLKDEPMLSHLNYNDAVHKKGK